MSSTPEVIKEFPVCPWCGSTETGAEMAIEHLGLREKGLVKPDDHVSIIKIPVQLINPGLAVLTVPVMIQENDCCGECGRNRTVRLTVMEMPLSTLKQQQQPG